MLSIRFDACIAVLIACLLTACAQTPDGPARARPPVLDPAERPAERALVAGIAMYEDTQYAEAEAQISKALGMGLGTPRNQALAHKYLAFIYCNTKRMRECEASFRNASKADPDFALNKLEEGHPLWGPVALAAARGSYPRKSVRLIVPFAPGGTTDLIARAVSQKMGQALGQPVVVDNRAGSGGLNGAQEAAQASPDGHTLSIATVSTMAANPAINPKMPYDPVADFVPIVNMAATPNIIAVHPSFPAKDYAGFLAVLSKNPGKFSYGSSGTGGIGHLQMELFKTLTKTYVLHLPYPGAGPALADAAAGKVPIIFDNLPSALPYIKSGRLVPIAVASPLRLPSLPDVPTFKELGLEPVNRMAFYGLLAPKGTPKDVLDKLSAAMASVLADGAIRRRIEDTGAVIVGNTPEDFARQIHEELAIYKQVVRVQKLTLD